MPTITRKREPSRFVRRMFELRFRRSKRGNLWCELPNRLNCTILRQYGCEDGFVYCTATSEGPEYSESIYESEEAAVDGLFEYLYGIVE